MNLNELMQQGTLSDYYRMHTFGGIQKIKEQWIDNKKWYWPQPICQIGDLMKVESQNFTSLSVLRLYLGEKISFFFAWKSYLTCALIVIAFPGALLQIYILYNDDYVPGILPYWVVLVCLWSTIQVEGWKRVTSEITARWGSLDLLDREEMRVRDGFSGDEEIDDTTGELSKY
jgi:anoctamin-8